MRRALSARAEKLSASSAVRGGVAIASLVCISTVEDKAYDRRERSSLREKCDGLGTSGTSHPLFRLSSPLECTSA